MTMTTTRRVCDFVGVTQDFLKLYNDISGKMKVTERPLEPDEVRAVHGFLLLLEDFSSSLSSNSKGIFHAKQMTRRDAITLCYVIAIKDNFHIYFQREGSEERLLNQSANYLCDIMVKVAKEISNGHGNGGNNASSVTTLLTIREFLEAKQRREVEFIRSQRDHIIMFCNMFSSFITTMDTISPCNKYAKDCIIEETKGWEKELVKLSHDCCKPILHANNETPPLKPVKKLCQKSLENAIRCRPSSDQGLAQYRIEWEHSEFSARVASTLDKIRFKLFREALQKYLICDKDITFLVQHFLACVLKNMQEGGITSPELSQEDILYRFSGGSKDSPMTIFIDILNSVAKTMEMHLEATFQYKEAHELRLDLEAGLCDCFKVIACVYWWSRRIVKIHRDALMKDMQGYCFLELCMRRTREARLLVTDPMRYFPNTSIAMLAIAPSWSIPRIAGTLMIRYAFIRDDSIIPETLAYDRYRMYEQATKFHSIVQCCICVNLLASFKDSLITLVEDLVKLMQKSHVPKQDFVAQKLRDSLPGDQFTYILPMIDATSSVYSKVESSCMKLLVDDFSPFSLSSVVPPEDDVRNTYYKAPHILPWMKQCSLDDKDVVLLLPGDDRRLERGISMLFGCMSTFINMANNNADQYGDVYGYFRRTNTHTLDYIRQTLKSMDVNPCPVPFHIMRNVHEFGIKE